MPLVPAGDWRAGRHGTTSVGVTGPNGSRVFVLADQTITHLIARTSAAVGIGVDVELALLRLASDAATVDAILATETVTGDGTTNPLRAELAVPIVITRDTYLAVVARRVDGTSMPMAGVASGDVPLQTPFGTGRQTNSVSRNSPGPPVVSETLAVGGRNLARDVGWAAYFRTTDERVRQIVPYASPANRGTGSSNSGFRNYSQSLTAAVDLQIHEVRWWLLTFPAAPLDFAIVTPTVPNEATIDSVLWSTTVTPSSGLVVIPLGTPLAIPAGTNFYVVVHYPVATSGLSVYGLAADPYMNGGPAQPTLTRQGNATTIAPGQSLGSTGAAPRYSWLLEASTA